MPQPATPRAVVIPKREIFDKARRNVDLALMPSEGEASLNTSFDTRGTNNKRETRDDSARNAERPTFNIQRPMRMPAEGIEPTRSCDHWILSPALC